MADGRVVEWGGGNTTTISGGGRAQGPEWGNLRAPRTQFFVRKRVICFATRPSGVESRPRSSPATVRLRRVGKRDLRPVPKADRRK